MSITRTNEFYAQDGKSPELREFLRGVIKMVTAAKGCQLCQLFESQDKPGHFLVIEVWTNHEAHEAAAKTIPPDAFQKLMAIAAAPPKGEYFNLL